MRRRLLVKCFLVTSFFIVPWLMVSGCGPAEGGGTWSFGALKVTIEPAAAVTGGARWYVLGGAQASGSTVSGLVAGAHTVTFRPVTGYTTPAAVNATVVGGQTTEMTVTYAPVAATTGTLTVNITPAAAVTGGAKWTLDGNATEHESGTPLTGVAAGDHTVAFTTINGYTTPANQTVTVTAGATTTVDAAYTAINASMGTIKVTCEPAAVRTAGAQWAIDGGTFHDSGEAIEVEPGTHEISYKYISGWYRPANLTIDVVAGEVYERTITYSVAVGRADDPQRR